MTDKQSFVNPQAVPESERLDEKEADLLGLAKALLHRWRLLVVAAFVGGVLFLVGSILFITTTYQSYFTAYVNNTQQQDSTSVSSSDVTASRYLADTYAEVITSKNNIMAALAAAGINTLSSDFNYETYEAAISVETVNDTEIVLTSVILPDPVEAYKIAAALEQTSVSYVESIVEGSSMRIIQSSELPERRYAPSYKKNAAMGAALFFVICAVAICVSALLDRRIKKAEDLELKFGFPVIGTVHDMLQSSGSGYYGYGQSSSSGKKKKKSKVKANPNAPVILGDKSNFQTKEDYRMLVTNVEFSMPGGGSRVIALTSTQTGEGKSTNAINLAKSLASAEYKVLLIECDMRLPTLAAKLRLKHEKDAGGLSDVLIGRKLVKDVVLPVSRTLRLITGGTIPPDPVRLLRSESMNILIDNARNSFDYIILDLPPATSMADASVLSPLVDGYLVVVKHANTETGAIAAMLQQLNMAGAKILGFVYTCSPIKGSGYYKSYNYYDKYSKAGKEAAHTSAKPDAPQHSAKSARPDAPQHGAKSARPEAK